MTYALFFYNYVIALATSAVVLGFGALYIRRRKRLDLYGAFLFSLYLIDITLLWMMESIPAFAEAFGVMQTQRHFFYVFLNTLIVFCYRLILGDLLDYPISNYEAIGWTICLTGTTAEWVTKSSLYPTVIDAWFRTITRIWVIGSSVWIYLRQRNLMEARRAHCALALALVFAASEITQIVFPQQGSRVPSYEIMGGIYTIVALVYLASQLKQNHERAKEFSLHSVTSRYDLTRREEDLLKLLLEHKSNREIAEELCISLSTVKTHVHHIYDKMGVSSREALRKVVEQGLGGTPLL